MDSGKTSEVSEPKSNAQAEAQVTPSQPEVIEPEVLEQDDEDLEESVDHSDEEEEAEQPEEEQQEFEPENDDEDPEELIRYQHRPRPVKKSSLFQSFLAWPTLNEEDDEDSDEDPDYVPPSSDSDSDDGSLSDSNSMSDSDDDADGDYLEDPDDVCMKDQVDVLQDSDDEMENRDEENEDVKMVSVQKTSSKHGVKRLSEEPAEPTKQGKKNA